MGQTGKIAVVHNPAPNFTLPSTARKRNPKRRATKSRRRNPTARSTRRRNPATVAMRRNPSRRTVKATSHRRRRNPSRTRNPQSLFGLVSMALVTSFGVGVLDNLLNMVFPTAGSAVRVGAKAGAAALVHQYGGRLPVIGQYHKEISLVLLVSAGLDAWKLYIYPAISDITRAAGVPLPGFLAPGGYATQQAMLTEGDEEMSDDYYDYAEDLNATEAAVW